MNLDTLKQLDKKYAQVIADYLLNRIETDLCLKEKLETTNKTLKGCVDYVKSKAKKQAEDNVAIIQDEEVYGWVVHYFIEDSLDFEPKEEDPEVEEIEQEKEETSIIEKPAPKEEIKKPIKKDIKKEIKEQLTLFDL